MSPFNLFLSTLTVVVMLLHSVSLHAQAPKTEQTSELQELTAMMSQLQRLTTDSRLAKDLELTEDQKTKLQIATQKFMDATIRMRRDSQGGKFKMERYKELGEEMMLSVKNALTAKQTDKLSELAKEMQKKQQANMPTQSQMQEMQRLNSMMSELQRMSYDPDLSEKLGLTAEQKVQIREASQKFSRAMQERMRANQGQPFDMNRYSTMVGDLIIEAQAILTPEQADILAQTAKLKRLKQRFGDEFALIIGLAEEFDMHPSDTKRLREEISEAREDYYKRLNKLKEETLDRIIFELPREHREEVREAVRTFFEDDPRKKRSGFGSTIRIGN